jgi:hypothetical protein
MAIEPNSPTYRNPVEVNHTKKDRRRAPYPDVGGIVTSSRSCAARPPAGPPTTSRTLPTRSRICRRR